MEHYATAQQVFVGGLIFARLAALVMLIPGIGETFVPARIRLALAFVMTLCLYPVLSGAVPPVPPTVADLAGAVIKEVLIGLMIGGILRLFMNALAVTGEIVSIQTTLSFAQTANPGQPPTTTVGVFLMVLCTTLLFATGLHHMFIGAMVKSYTLFPIGRGIAVQDFGQLAVRTFGQTFSLGVQLAAPVIVFSLVFNIAVGFIGRVMPQFQVFFVATPLIVLLGLAVFALSLGTIGLVWVERYRELVGAFLGQ